MRKPPMPDLRKSSGAFDLPSIITGVVVVGILAAGVLAAIFGVIPYTQNNGAKQDLSAIRTAEGVARAKDNRFMDHAGLIDTGYLQLASTEKTKVMADEKGTCYVALAKSGTGKIFYATDANTDPELFEADTDPGCLPAEKLAELIDAVGGTEDATPAGAPRNLKLTAVSAIEARTTWDAVKGADGYKVEYRIGDATDWTVKAEKTTATSTSINALPEQTVTVQVYALTGEKVSEPSAATVKLPDSTLKNPSFENGSLGWTLGGASSLDFTHSTAKAHTGKASVIGRSSIHSTATQTVAVPSGSPVLTYWLYGSSTASVDADGKTLGTAPTGRSEDGWVQHAADVSAYTGKTVSLTLRASTYLDDVAFEGPKVPSQPQAINAYSRSGTVTAKWSAPVFTGGTPITGYRVTAWAGDKQAVTTRVSAGERTAIVQGLNTGDSYDFTVAAENEIGTSLESASYGPVKTVAGSIANPSFENGSLGWTLGGASSLDFTHSTAKAHTGKASVIGRSSIHSTATQTVAVPSGSPVLTYWLYGSSTASVDADGKTLGTAPTGRSEDGWVQHAADVSAYTGKTVSLTLRASTYLDDIAFEQKG